MLAQILLGGVVTSINIVVQALAMLGVMAVDQGDLSRRRRPVLAFAVRMVGVVTVLNLAHLAQIALWATAYRMFGVVVDADLAFYFAFVNFATLGYGDIVPAEGWRLIGPATAINGVLMLGWSTAVMMWVLARHGAAFGRG